MPAAYEWSSSKRKKRSNQFPSCEVSNHPLKLTTHSSKQSISKDFIDKLNKWSMSFEVTDPLLRFEQMNEDETFQENKKIDLDSSYSKVWNSKRSNILNKYTTAEKLTIVSSFLPGGEKALIKQVSNLNEKVKHRLEQLDEFDESSVRKTIGLSQQDFVLKINMLNDEIKNAWATEQRVKAFKIAIQCSKLLADTSVMQFYPSKFIIITDTLDMFGDLVFERLRDKSYGSVHKPIQDIDPDNVPEGAKETCLNWIYKMASIRELLPRLYLEMALLKCYAFTSKTEIKSAIERLTLMVRGVGDPIVAVYLRFYLCRVASKLLGKCEKYYYDNFKEFLDDYPRIFYASLKKRFESQSLSLDKYLSIYIPAVDWLMNGMLTEDVNKPKLLEELLEHCAKIDNNELLLYCILTSFDSVSINDKCTQILEIIKESAEVMVMCGAVVRALGEHACGGGGGGDAHDHVAQTCWKIANNITAPAQFLHSLEPWMEYTCTHLSTQHVNVILRGIIRYMIKCGQPADEYSGNFQLLFRRILNSVPDVEELFLMDAFMPLIELVQTTSARTLMAKTVLSIFFKRYNAVHIEDPIVINGLMRLCCILHDSINAVTVEDESKSCAELINQFVQAVRYSDDCEQQLNFYVDCRAAFIKLDATLIVLIHAVNALSVRAGGGRAGAAFCSVTVPSLGCALARARLHLLTAQVALLNNCIGQAEANFKALVGLIPDIPEYIYEDGQQKQTSSRVGDILSNFLSILLILPDNMESNCKVYVLSGFIKTLERIHWHKTDPLYHRTLLHTLDLLTSMTQDDYSYHIESVLSNDVLYGADEEFIAIIEKYATTICQELLLVLKQLGETSSARRDVALSLLWRVLTRAELTHAHMSRLAYNLWMLLRKHNDVPNKLMNSMLSTLSCDNDQTKRALLEQLETANTGA